MVKAVLDELPSSAEESFTVGITDDVTNYSLQVDTTSA